MFVFCKQKKNEGKKQHTKTHRHPNCRGRMTPSPRSQQRPFSFLHLTTSNLMPQLYKYLNGNPSDRFHPSRMAYFTLYLHMLHVHENNPPNRFPATPVVQLRWDVLPDTLHHSYPQRSERYEAQHCLKRYWSDHGVCISVSVDNNGNLHTIWLRDTVVSSLVHHNSLSQDVACASSPPVK